MSGRAPFVVFSVVAHVALMVGLGKMRVSESHAATAIAIADVPKPKKEPPKTVVEPEPVKPEHRAPVHHAAAPPPPAANTPPPPAPRAKVALADAALPDFGVSLSGAVGGDGVALPMGAPVTQAAATRSAPVHRALAQAPGPNSTQAACDESATKPRPLNVPQPSYNSNARAAGVEGKVRVRLTVDETGKVVDVSVIAGLGYGLDEAALAAAREATFEPATQCGKPVRATFTISMRFTAG